MNEELIKEEENNNEFRYKLVKKGGVISVNSKGWTKEINLISYNGKKSVVDIRLWSPSRKMSKGITLSQDDINRTIELLNKMKKYNKGE